MLENINVNLFKLMGKTGSLIPYISESQANTVLASETAIPQPPSKQRSDRIKNESIQRNNWLNKMKGPEFGYRKRKESEENRLTRDSYNIDNKGGIARPGSA